MRTPEEDLRAYLDHQRARGCSLRTVRAQQNLLAHFLLWFRETGHADLSEASEAILEEYLSSESRRESQRDKKPLSPWTIEAKAYALRGFFRFLVKEKVLLASPAQDLGRGKRRGRCPRPVPTREEMRLLLEASGKGRNGLRNRAILETLYSTGLRCAELCGLDLQDVDRSAGAVWVRNGKGGKDRVVAVGARALEALRLYLEQARARQKPRTSALFVTSLGNRLGVNETQAVVRKARLRAGIATPVTPHALRHAFATHLLENGASIRHVQAMLGHASIKSTQIYTAVSTNRLKGELASHDPRSPLGEDGPPPAPLRSRWATHGVCMYFKPRKGRGEEPSSI